MALKERDFLNSQTNPGQEFNPDFEKDLEKTELLKSIVSTEDHVQEVVNSRKFINLSELEFAARELENGTSGLNEIFLNSFRPTAESVIIETDLLGHLGIKVLVDKSTDKAVGVRMPKTLVS